MREVWLYCGSGPPACIAGLRPGPHEATKFVLVNDSYSAVNAADLAERRSEGAGPLPPDEYKGGRASPDAQMASSAVTWARSLGTLRRSVGRSPAVVAAGGHHVGHLGVGAHRGGHAGVPLHLPGHGCMSGRSRCSG